MSIKITKLEIKNPINKKTRKPYAKPSFFNISIEFEVKNENEYDKYELFFSPLESYYQTFALNDPKKHDAELDRSFKKHKNDITKIFGKPLKEDWFKVWTSGSGIVFRKGKKFCFTEFFTYTPVTRGILTELKKMKKDPTYSKKVVPEQYLANLLTSLAKFWD